MKLKFDPALGFQQDAIQAVVKVFEGQASSASGASPMQPAADGGLLPNELGTGNRLDLSQDLILENVQKVQEANHIEKVTYLEGREGKEFSIEMETGTGKTYVYLRTLFELNQAYGFRKFIIVVPSVAVREGVLKSLEIMKPHFHTLYNKVPFDFFVYDSKQLGKVRSFAVNNQIQIMVINIQAFVKDVPDKEEAELTEDELKKLNVINRENDRMSGRRPIEFIQTTKPIVIIDEPQSVDNTDKAKRAIARLHPMATLRYSATHREARNLLYKLDPVKAYDLRLVKRIEVASVQSDDNFNAAYVKLLRTDNKNGIRAQVQINRIGSRDMKATQIWVKQGEDLYKKSNENAMYQDGYIVQRIDCTPGAEALGFASGRWLALGQELGGSGDDVMKAQVEKTVEQHLAKELTLKGKGIKVLSLFFVDRVSNYRIYHDNGAEKALGKIGQWFEDAYRDCMKRPRFMELPSYDVKQVHNGYFSKDKKQKPKDTRGNTKDDESTYNLIMREKEKLLDEAEPLRFIFSHSALREGWDNPNVFQICTLNETKSKDKKRQEIGRGLRLPVNRDGERVHDETVNRLTVVANEAYEEFARTLQEELEEECGIRFGVVREIDFAELSAPDADGQEVELGQDGSRRLWKALVEQGYLDQSGAIQPAFNPADPSFDCEVPQEFAHLKPQIIDLLNGRIFKNRVVNVAERRQVKFRKKVQLGDAFKELWERIKHRTRYRVKFKTDDLIKKAVARIGELDDIKPARIKISRARLDIELYGVDTGDPVEDYTVDAAPVSRLPDILAYLQKETELTRHTLAEILKQCGKLGQFRLNPQAFMLAVGKAISRALQDLMLEGIQYDKVPGNHWEMSRIAKDAEAGVVRYLHNLYQVQSKGKTLFDAIEYDSEVERKFAQDLDNNEHVRLFVKLPGWFKIDTPIGPYNPDWAFVTERDEKLYFVRETKSTLDTDELRVSEKRKIDCGKQHFKALGVDFGVVTELSEVPIR